MARLHLHLISDSTGETLETVAKSALALFDGVETVKHFWPMVRSEVQLARIIEDVAANPGLTLYTIVNPDMRAALEEKCGAAGLPAIAVLDPVVDALASLLGQPAKARRGYQHNMDDAYFRRVEAIQFTIAHDDGARNAGTRLTSSWQAFREPPKHQRPFISPTADLRLPISRL
jgi:[pyruvate, water dikinase]-phosphate phosphotransferase / [pyruvate, water dikinase] kinase